MDLIKNAWKVSLLGVPTKLTSGAEEGTQDLSMARGTGQESQPADMPHL
jgi:hypothetical protein